MRKDAGARQVAGLALGALLAGCSGIGLPLPDALEPLPADASHAGELVAAARAAHERDESKDALGLLERALALEPEHVEGHRLRQDILRDRGRTGLLLWESEERLRLQPDDAIAHYLAGRIALDDDAKLAHFLRATELAPRTLWGWLGVAFVMRRRAPEEASALYARLYALSGGEPVVAIAWGSLLRELTRYDDALTVYAQLRQRAGYEGIGDLGIAEVQLVKTGWRAAWPAMLSALGARPFDPGVHRLVLHVLVHGLNNEQVEHLLDQLRVEPERLALFRRHGNEDLLARLFARADDPHAARAGLEPSAGMPPDAPQLRRPWRRMLLSAGDVRGFLRDFAATFPRYVLNDEANQVRGLWLTLLEGPWMRARDPLVDVAMAADLVGALVATGLLDEAEMVGTLALQRHGTADDGPLNRLQALRDEARRERSFERTLRRIVYGNYGPEYETASLTDVLRDLRKVSQEMLGRDVVGEPATFHLPLIGQLVDPFAPGLGRHLARYNRHLVLGQRSGRPPEALLLTRLSVRDLEAVAELPLAARCLEVIGDDRQISGLSSLYGGDPAGVALFNHYLIDMDAVRDWAHGLLERRRVAREDGLALLDDPLPRGADELAPLDVEWRLAVRAPIADEDLEAAVLDIVRWHERLHLVDSFHYLPPEANLWRVLGLLLRHGFDAASIEAEMEARAEVASLARSAHTELVLAHIAGFLDDASSSSPHAVGFQRLALRMLALGRERGLPGQVARWEKGDMARFREIGRALLEELW